MGYESHGPNESFNCAGEQDMQKDTGHVSDSVSELRTKEHAERRDKTSDLRNCPIQLRWKNCQIEN